ncbi:DUF1048 domain-containing protein [Clostridium cochlearium]|uniref:DUF1048 domain-containing protein n=1 Tax=Clostridium cochlearium TaxID=1494 RepID=UPI001EDF0504|nr:DUF1048 domain-containing protein [Clostridium cochlearium]MCG4579925.1 DUF1048 domain-containing protein [Clostridium cochlearium]
MFLELKLLKIRMKEEKKLNKENHTLFKEIEEYMNNSTLSSFEKEDFFQQLLDIMLQSQLQNKSIDLFIGEDHKQFCDSIINEYNVSKSFILKTINFIEQFIVYIGVWIILDMIFYFKLHFKVSSLITASLFCIILYIKKSQISSKDNVNSGLKSLSFIVPIVFISKIIINIGTDMLSVDISKTISLYSIRYFIVISILFFIFSEFYKIKSNKSKIIV